MMTRASWFTAIYLLALSGACFYSIYLMSIASGINNPAIMFQNRSTNKEEEDLMNKTRTLLNYYKIMTYVIIGFNGAAIIGLFLGAFKIVVKQ